MISDLVRFSQTVSRLNGFKPADQQLHDALVKTLSRSVLPSVRVAEIFDWFRKPDFGNDDYWIAAFEALLAGYYGEAKALLLSIEEQLNIRNDPQHRFYPSVLIGILKAVNWYEGGHEHREDRATFSEFPDIYGGLLKAYAEEPNHRGYEKSEYQRLLGLFSSEFDVFARRRVDTKEGRQDLLKLSRSLRNIEFIDYAAERFINEVSSKLFFLLGAKNSLYLVCDEWIRIVDAEVQQV